MEKTALNQSHVPSHFSTNLQYPRPGSEKLPAGDCRKSILRTRIVARDRYNQLVPTIRRNSNPAPVTPISHTIPKNFKIETIQQVMRNIRRQESDRIAIQGHLGIFLDTVVPQDIRGIYELVCRLHCLIRMGATIWETVSGRKSVPGAGRSRAWGRDLRSSNFEPPTHFPRGKKTNSKYPRKSTKNKIQKNQG